MATIKGSWILNETITHPASDVVGDVNFTSNGESFERIQFGAESTKLVRYYYSIAEGTTLDAYHITWNEAYRIIDFGETEQTVSETFYNTFTANATEYEGTATTVTIKKGTYKFNDDVSQPTFSGHFPLPTTVKVFVTSEYVIDINKELASEGLSIAVQDYSISTTFSSWEFCQGSETTVENGYQEYSLINLAPEGRTITPYDEIIDLLLPLGGSEIYHSLYGGINEEYSLFTVTKDTVVEDEAFATWFTTNTKEVKAISGKRRFKDTITSLSYEKYGFTCSLADRAYRLEKYGVDISPVSLTYEGYNITLTRITPSFFCGDMFDDNGKPTIFIEELSLGVTVDGGEYIAMPVTPSDIANQVFDFGTEPQYIPVDAWDWIMENSDEVIAKKFTRLYIGNSVASSGGKCFKRLTTEEPKLTDLTGTTWYVPSGWSATAGYGDFEIIGEFIRPTYSFEIEKFGVGYATSQASADKLRLKRPEIYTPYSFLKVDGEFTLKISGGTDVTNPDLISWLETYGTMQ